MKTDEVYKAAFEESWAIGVGSLADDAREKGTIGHKEYLVYQGRFTYAKYDEEGQGIGEPLFIMRPDTQLRLAVLRAADPAWRDRQTTEHTGKNGGPIEGAITVTFVKSQ